MTETDLNPDDGLVQAALHARNLAYAPYSKFLVGSAVVGESGRVFTGANVENASYGLTMCAERIAIFEAVSAGERSIRAIAVVTGSETVTPPCGACRQVIMEHGPDALIFGANLAGKRQTWAARDLLPDPFGPVSVDFTAPPSEPKG